MTDITGTNNDDTLTGTRSNDNLFGLAGNDTLVGGRGDDELDGGTGADKMEGGAGNDTYVVDDAGDQVIETANGGGDSIDTTLSTYVLPENFEDLRFIGAGDFTGTGNALGNFIFGGGTGNNTLSGGGGDDNLIAGGKHDTLSGGTGNDTFDIGSTDDIVVENAGEGHDTVQFNANTGSYALTDNVEDLVLLGHSGDENLGGVGNLLDNRIFGNDGDNTIHGGAGNDTLIGAAGDDTLDGGPGADTMIGGAGDDTYVLDDKGDKVIEGKNSGIDTVETFVDGTVLGANVENLLLEGLALTGTGNNLNNAITGNIFDNRLDGSGGNDAISGGFGNDVILGGAGNDAASGGDGNDEIHGGKGDDTLDGNAGDDRLVGNAGNDTLDGGIGADKMEGGAGNDSYLVDTLGDQVIEGAHQGIDTVVTTLDSFTLAANFENLTLISQQGSFDGHGIGNDLNNRIIGGNGHDTLEGGAGNDYLEGGNGNDTLFGGAGDDVLRTGGPDPDGFGQNDFLTGGTGNDTYICDSFDVTITEMSGQGIDTVILQAPFTAGSDPFQLADNVENLTLVDQPDSDALAASGNGLDNVITGGTGDNTLAGSAGDDTLIGGAGFDDLTGGTGRDVLIGGTSSDNYHLFADDANDKVVELAGGGGNDTVFSLLANYTLTANVESLILQGTGDINGTGNALGNLMAGNDGNNHLSGGGGNDFIAGGKGDDVLHGDAGNDDVEGQEGDDTIDGGAGNDILRGGAGSDVITGGVGDDQLDGQGGIDTMSGGAGNDAYSVDDRNDMVIEGAHQGHDTIFSLATSFDLSTNGIGVEDLLFETGKDNSGRGNDLDNEITGNVGNDTLFAGAGNDFVTGGEGGDLINGEAGNDTLAGGAGGDALLGGAGIDVLDGGTGADDMRGESGNDLYFVDDVFDATFEDVGQGIDTVKASISWTLEAGQEIEILILTGTLAIDGTGNEFANTIVGNSAANTLEGGGGNDTLIGGEGNDTYVLDAGDAQDKIVETGHSNHDTVQLHFATPTAYHLAAGVEQLDLSDAASSAIGNSLNNLIEGLNGAVSYHLDGGAGNDTIVGSGADDVLLGGAGNDFLNGASGADHMEGGTGNDSYRVDDAGDVILEAKNGGTDTITSSISFDLGSHAANVEKLILADGAGNLEGHGNALNNVIIGNSGDNLLSGEAGNDVLEGGLGADTMDGGAGKDTFLYRVDANSQLAMLGGDTINNFESGKDRIDVRDLFHDFGISEKDNPFTTGHLALVDDGQGNTIVKFDADGSAGPGAAVTLATVVGHTVALTDIIH